MLFGVDCSEQFARSGRIRQQQHLVGWDAINTACSLFY